MLFAHIQVAFIAFMPFMTFTAFRPLMTFTAFIAFIDFIAFSPSDPSAPRRCLRPTFWPNDDCCFIPVEAFIAVIDSERSCFMAFIAFMESDLSCAGVLALRTEISEGQVFCRDAEATTECGESVLLCRPRFDRDALAHPGPPDMEDADTPRLEELQEEQMTALRRRELETNMAVIYCSYRLVHLNQTATDVPNEPNRE